MPLISSAWIRERQKIYELDRSQRKQVRGGSDQSDWIECKDVIVIIKITTA
jgi:hypothetical protein